MLRSRFFWKLYASYALVLAVVTAVVAVVLEPRMRGSLEAGAEARLRAQCESLAPFALEHLRGGWTPELQRDVDGIARGSGSRITLIAADGEVVVDSHEHAPEMENHRGRPEVIAALSGSYGVARRRSATLEIDMLFVARALRNEQELTGVVRVGLQRDLELAELRRLRATLALAAGLGLLGTLGLGALVARRITAPIEEMKRVADDFRQARYESRVRSLPRDELGLLGATLNQLGEEITRRISTISKDDARLRAMLAGMAEGVVAVDDEDRILFYNRAAGELLDLDRDSAEGEPLWELVRVAGLHEIVEQTRGGDAAAEKELTVPIQAGTRALLAHANAFRAGETGGVVVVLQDVTALRRLESVRRDFVANVSHELKTPLTAIRGYVETLLDGALEDSANNRRFLTKVDDHVNRLRHLVSDLLSLARIEAQGEALATRAVEWNEVLGHSLPRHREAMAGRDITCTVEAERVRVLGDQESMTQVLDNLLDNATKYTQLGGRVLVRVSRRDAAGVLEVIDSGIGIPAQDLDRIFERFYRVDKARSREMGGTGLGLSIVKHLVQSMGGEVRVESEVGVGTRFEVSLPLA